MPITINGSGTITGVSVGGLPDGSVDADTLASSAKGLYKSYAHLSHRENANVQAGGISSGSWVKRPINNEVSDPDGIVSISSDQFTLQAGTYRIQAECIGYDVENQQARIYNATDSSTTLIGLNTKVSSDNDSIGATVVGRFTISGAKTFELQHRVYSTTNTHGRGSYNNYDIDSCYADVEIWMEN